MFLPGFIACRKFIVLLRSLALTMPDTIHMHIFPAATTFHGISAIKNIPQSDINNLGSDYYLSIIACKTDD